MPADSCPKCGRPRSPSAAECPACGVVFARYHAGPHPVAPAAAGPEPAAPASAAYLSAAKVETLLRLIAQSLSAGLTLPAFARSGGLHGLPPAVAERIRRDADAGVELSRTLSALGAIDGPAAGLLRAKEVHGGVPEALTAIADRIQGRRKALGRLLGIAIYPYFLLLALAAIGPAPLFFSSGAAAYLAAALPALAALVAAPVFALVLLPRLDRRGRLKRWAARAASRLPLAGAGARNGALSAFCDVLGSALRAGVPVREALPLAADAAQALPALDGCGARLVEALDAGATLTAALGKVPGFPPILLAQLGSGEASGTLDVVLERARQDFEDRARGAWLMTAVVAGGAVAVLVLGFAAFQIVAGFKTNLGVLTDRIDRASAP